MNLKLFALTMLFILYRFGNSDAETITYIDTEHPDIVWYDTRFFYNVTMISKRSSRRDPRHYVDLYIHSSVILDNQIGVNFYFYQFLTNRYQPSFIEMHFKLCDFLQKDIIFGTALRRELGNRTCPYPPVRIVDVRAVRMPGEGKYDLKKMYIPYVPKGFPFVKGRIYCNMTHERNGEKRLIVNGYIDMEVKVAQKLRS